MEEKTVLLERKGAVATVILNRPKAMNSFNKELVDEFIKILEEIANDDDIRAVIITGAGKAFCAGGDLFYLSSLKNIVEARKFIIKVGSIVEKIMGMDKPVVAMVNGVAAGAGFNLALACDIVYCTTSVRFGQSFVKVGLVPDCGGQYLLPRIVGMHKAKELMFTGDLIDADTAFKYGIVNKVLNENELETETYNFAKKIAELAPIPLGMMKKLLNKSDNLSLNDVLAYEADLQAICMATNDHQEGVAAFKAKRKPVFNGN